MTWRNDESVKKWFSEISERTRENCIKPFELWLGFINMTPDAQIQKRVKDFQSTNPQVRRYFEDKLIAWKNSLESETNKDDKRRYASTTVRSMLQRTQSFFAHNNLGLRFGKGQLKVEPSKREKVSLKWVLMNTEVRMLYKRATLDEKCRLLVLYQSGFSPIDLCELKIQDFPEIYTCESHHYIAKMREKTNIIQQTCLSVEAIHDIRLSLERRNNPKQGFLLVTRNKTQINPKFLNESMKNLALTTFGKEKAKKFQTKNLRDSYKNGLLRAKLDAEIKDCMFGHKRQGAKQAYQLSQLLIEESYEKAFSYLSINHGLMFKTDVQDLKQTVLGQAKLLTELQGKFGEVLKALEDQKQFLEDRLQEQDKQKKLLDFIEQRVKELTKNQT